MREELEELVSSLLYEGYALYPYTPEATKNATPTPFGIVYPPGYAAECTGAFDHARLECLAEPRPGATISVTLRYLSSSGERHHAQEQRVELGPAELGDRISAEFKEKVVQALIEKNDLEIPEALIGQQLDMMLENTKKRLAYQKLSLEMMGLDDEKYNVQFRSVAISQVKGSLLLEALARQEGLTVAESDIEEKLRQISGDDDQSLAAVKKHYLHNAKAKENITAQIREDKAISFIVERAKVTEVSKDQLGE